MADAFEWIACCVLMAVLCLVLLLFYLIAFVYVCIVLLRYFEFLFVILRYNVYTLVHLCKLHIV